MSFIDIKSLPKKEIVKGYTGRSLHTGSMTFMYWTVTEGSIMPTHNHIHQQVAHVLKGRFQLQVNEEIMILEPGMVVIIDPNVPHSGIALTDCELLDVFYPEREDYKF